MAKRLAMHLTGVALAWAISASALYVIPYEMRLGESRGGVGDFARGERYTVVVLLGDYHGRVSGIEDDLQRLMAGNRYANGTRAFDQYLSLPYEWYLEGMAAQPRVYGPRAREVAASFAGGGPRADGRSSIILITEYGRLDRPLFLLRAEPGDARGLVPIERSFLTRGLGEPYPAPPGGFVTHDVPIIRAAEATGNVFPIGFDQPVRTVTWRREGAMELKNFSIDPDHVTRFFPYGYAVARAHRLLFFGGHALPADLDRWVHGQPLDEWTRRTHGAWTSELRVGAFSRIMERYYGGMGFRTWRTLNNEHTFGLDFHFMHADAAEVDRTLLRIVNGVYAHSMERAPKWLVYSPDLARKFKRATCAEQLMEATRIVHGIQ